MRAILITGANRGLGLAFCKHYLEMGDFVVACCRSEDSKKTLQGLSQDYSGSLSTIKLDMSNDEEIQKLKYILQDKPIDILINNAGIDQTKDINYKTHLQPWQELFCVNAVAPYLLSHALKDIVKQSQERKIINISSYMASISLNNNGKGCAYRASKSALNALTKNLAIEFIDENIVAVAIDPGWVKTDMGGPQALLKPEESVLGIARIISNLTMADSGKFISYNGIELSW